MTEAERKELHGLRAARNALVSCGGPLCDEDAARLNELQAKEDAAKVIAPEPAKCTLCGNVHQFGEICLASIHGARR